MKKYSKRRNYVARRRPRKTWANSNWGTVAKKAFRIATKVAKFVNAEYKYYEFAQTAQTLDYNGAMWTLFNPAQGTSVNQRDGDSVKMVNLTIEGSIVRNGIDDIVRLIIYKDREMTTSVPSDLMENVADPQVVFSNKNQDNKFNTKILVDRKFTITSNSPLHRFNIVRKIPYHVHWTAGTTTIKNNGIRIMLFSQQSTGGSKVTYHSRISYLDN